jgi:hypothetical protein
MELKLGDLIITLPRVSKIQAVVNLTGGEMGIIVEKGPEGSDMPVYGVIINEQLYYLFEDEFEKLEEKC